MPRITKFTISFLLLLILSACTAAPLPTTTPESTQTSTVTSISTITVTANPSSTSIPTPSPTTDPVRLLPVYEPQNYLNHILYDDDICMLPCWGNITLGETTYDTAFRYLRPIIDLPEDHVYVPEIRIERRNGFRLIADDEGEWIKASFHYDSDGIIQLIETNRIGYNMQQLIQTYGRPQGFYFFSYYDIEYAYKRMTNVIFFYPDQHFMAVYTQVDDVEAFINFCSSNIERDRSPDLMIWSGEKDFESLSNLYYAKSGLHELIRNVNDYASEEAIEAFFNSAGRDEMCLLIDYPWN
jgi:hypothetical protein